MIKRKSLGSALVDYVIPTAVVGLVVGTGIYYLASEGKILNFTAASGNMNVKVSDNMAIVGYKAPTNNDLWNPMVAGSLGGTEDTPISSCNAGNCTIDYGDFLLNGIPEDFSEFIQVNGTSGGTDKLLSLLGQMADQLEKDGDLAGAEEFRDLANLGEFIANTQKDIENDAKNCNTSSENSIDAVICFQSTISDPIAPPLPDNISHLLTTYNNSGTENDSSFITSNITGDAKSKKEYNPDTFDLLKTEHPAYAMVEIFDSINSNPNYSPTMKKVAEEVYRDLDTLSLEFRVGVANYTYPPSTAMLMDFDPVTGDQVGCITEGSNINKPTTSLSGDLISKLIDVSNN